MQASDSAQVKRLLLASIVFLTAYGSLYPLSGWRSPGGTLAAQFFTATDRLSFGDILTNLVIYVPFGFVCVLGASRRTDGARIALATLAGFTLSLTMESLQAYLPQRVPSVFDLGLNTFGAAAGAALGLLAGTGSAARHRMRALVAKHCREDLEARIGLGILALWVASQWMPFIPSLDVGQIKHGYKTVWLDLTHQAPFDPRAAVISLCGAMVIASVAHRVWLPKSDRMRKTTLLVLGVLLLKGVVVSRETTLESLLGAVAGLALFRLASRLEILAARVLALLALAAMLFLAGAARGEGATGTLHAFNWIPFRGHLAHPLTGIMDLTGDLWPAAAAAFLLLAQWRHRRRIVAPVGLMLMTAIVFLIEWRQQYLPGRLGDMTDVVMAALAYLLPWRLLPPLDPRAKAPRPSRSKAVPYAQPRQRRRRRRHPVLVALLTLSLAFGIGGWLALYNPPVIEVVPDDTQLLRLPEGKALPAVQFQHFRSEHPRLPAPSAAELARLRAENPEWLALQAKRASGREPDLEAMVLMALVDPASIDLAALHRRLLTLKFVYRGNEQTKPLAKAYDWLYARWTPAQRDTLLRKTLDGCESQIAVIRDQRLSPYNVYLYNSPLQALMACALATYGEAPRADAVMRFTQDYWLNRVLPVWRQVMGQHGGWHEGGEYVGIGIGQAVYQLPAMWRTATGEDFFASEPGLRGFLDFLVQRQRPDGTYFRWGDAGYFDRDAPDRVPLAIEYRHAAAYSLGGCPKRVEPTAWPWGPLTDPTLCDETAAAKLELSTLFDGIGMLIARSDWGSDGTHVSFKAGNNYWSHSHLDQGAFTIFKRFPLAIDSGVYGTRYGSDHHMNYTYQTVAHNALTVTDPEDIAQAPSKDGARYIANDGGQRRIGSGWGMEPAPIDYDEWMLKSDIYRAGKILEYEHTAVFDSIVADLTAAYTNPASGKGLFSPRTRRVNSYQRSFAYDRDFDAVVIYDRVAIEQPHFHVRWLLHTVAKPAKGHHSFDVTVESKPNEVQRGRAGLRGYVPVPLDHHINLVGGPGYEFFVDGRNYDENGEVQREVTRKRLTEAGEWRIEIEPGEQGFKHEFLVLLLPWVDAPPADLDVRCSSEDKYHLCTLTRAGREMSYRVLRDSGRIERVTDVTARIEE